MSEKESIVETLERHEAAIKQLNSAFPKDEQGDVDYLTHRLFHKEQNEEAIDNKRKRSEILTNVWTWAVIGIITVLASNFVQNIPKILESLGK